MAAGMRDGPSVQRVRRSGGAGGFDIGSSISDHGFRIGKAVPGGQSGGSEGDCKPEMAVYESGNPSQR